MLLKKKDVDQVKSVYVIAKSGYYILRRKPVIIILSSF